MITTGIPFEVVNLYLYDRSEGYVRNRRSGVTPIESAYFILVEDNYFRLGNTHESYYVADVEAPNTSLKSEDDICLH